MKSLRIVLPLFLLVALPLQAFDSAAYFKKRVYQRPVFHLVESLCAGFEWDYGYGFAKNNLAVTMAGVEFAWKKAATTTSFGWFPKLRLMFARDLITDYKGYRYEGLRYSQFHFRRFDPVLPICELTFNVFLRYDLRLAFLSSIQPCVGLGAGTQTRQWNSKKYVSSVGADVETDVKYNFNYGILALGAELTIVPELCELAVNCRFAFGAMEPAEDYAAGNPMGYEGFHTSLVMSLAMNFYLF